MSDKRTDLQTTRPTSDALEALMATLPEEQRQALAMKSLEASLAIEAEAKRADERFYNSNREMDEAVRNTRDHNAIGTDFEAHYGGKTASGGDWGVKVKKSNNMLIMVISIAVAVLAFLMLSR